MTASWRTMNHAAAARMPTAMRAARVQARRAARGLRVVTRQARSAAYAAPANTPVGIGPMPPQRLDNTCSHPEPGPHPGGRPEADREIAARLAERISPPEARSAIDQRREA